MDKNKRPNPKYRREFLQIAGITVAGAAGLYLLRGDLTAIANAVQRQLNPDNSADIITEAEVNQNPATVTPEATPQQPTPRVQTSSTAQPTASAVVPRNAHANGYNLWDTINLDSAHEKQKYPLSLIVVDKLGRVLIGSNAWPVGYTEAAFARFQNPASFRILSYIPNARPLYQYNPHTWVHSGIYGKHRYFAGKLEEALRLTPESRTRTTAAMLASANEDFRGAAAYLCQARYADGFSIFLDVKPSTLRKLLDAFDGNVLSMGIASALRIPRSLLDEYGSEAVVSDPLPWMQLQAPKTISLTADQLAAGEKPPASGWGWEEALTSSRWYLAFCSASTAEELAANHGTLRIDEGEWIVGFDILDRKQSFDPFS